MAKSTCPQSRLALWWDQSFVSCNDLFLCQYSSGANVLSGSKPWDTRSAKCSTQIKRTHPDGRNGRVQDVVYFWSVLTALAYRLNGRFVDGTTTHVGKWLHTGKVHRCNLELVNRNLLGPCPIFELPHPMAERWKITQKCQWKTYSQSNGM